MVVVHLLGVVLVAAHASSLSGLPVFVTFVWSLGKLGLQVLDVVLDFEVHSHGFAASFGWGWGAFLLGIL